jgi:hypothetical protein
MRAVDVFSLCEHREYIERFQGLLINDHLVAVVGDMGLWISRYEVEDGKVIVDYEVHDVLLQVDYPTVDKPLNIEAAELAGMTFPQFINYLLRWDGRETAVDVNPGDYVYLTNGHYVVKVNYVYPNGTVSMDKGELVARSQYIELNKEETRMVQKLNESISRSVAIKEGYVYGKLGIEDGKVFIAERDGSKRFPELTAAFEFDNGNEMEWFTYSHVIEGKKKYVGKEVRYRPLVLTPLTEADYK